MVVTLQPFWKYFVALQSQEQGGIKISMRNKERVTEGWLALLFLLFFFFFLEFQNILTILTQQG